MQINSAVSSPKQIIHTKWTIPTRNRGKRTRVRTEIKEFIIIGSVYFSSDYVYFNNYNINQLLRREIELNFNWLLPSTQSVPNLPQAIDVATKRTAFFYLFSLGKNILIFYPATCRPLCNGATSHQTLRWKKSKIEPTHFHHQPAKAPNVDMFISLGRFGLAELNRGLQRVLLLQATSYQEKWQSIKYNNIQIWATFFPHGFVSND